MSNCIFFFILCLDTKVPIIISFLQVFDIIQNILRARGCSLPIYFLTFFNLLSFCIETHTYWLGVSCLLPLLENTASPLALASAFAALGSVDR